MAQVKIRSKFEVVIPRDVREKLALGVGTRLEAKVLRGRLVLTPMEEIRQDVERSLEDFKRGRSRGPFTTAEELLASLKDEGRKQRTGAVRRPAA